MADTLYEHIGRKIRELRRTFPDGELSQDDLGKLVNAPANTISRWETGTYKPTAEELDRLARLFKVSILVFFPEFERGRPPNRRADIRHRRSQQAGFRGSHPLRGVQESAQRLGQGETEPIQELKMSRHAYYEELKALAREKRALHGVDTAAFGLREVRGIYRAEGVKIDSWPLPHRVKALYMAGEDDPSVAIQPKLPDEPKLFALVHELKHHYADRPLLETGLTHCGDYNENELIEKGAEVFAAEFIYPEAEFAADIAALGNRFLDGGIRRPSQAKRQGEGQLHLLVQKARAAWAHSSGCVRCRSVPKA